MEKVNHRVVDNVAAMEKVNHRIVDNGESRSCSDGKDDPLKPSLLPLIL